MKKFKKLIEFKTGTLQLERADFEASKVNP